MDRAVSFSYFYGEESEQFSFYRIPKLLITGAQFKNLSTDAKLLYGLLLDRMSLSAKNGWYDEQGRVYIYYTLEEIMEDMNCGKDKGVKLLSELDANRGIGLIERVKQGQGRPARIYVKRFAARAVPPPSPEPPADLVEDPPVRSQDFGFSEVSPSSEVLTSEKPKSILIGITILIIAIFTHLSIHRNPRWMGWIGKNAKSRFRRISATSLSPGMTVKPWTSW